MNSNGSVLQSSRFASTTSKCPMIRTGFNFEPALPRYRATMLPLRSLGPSTTTSALGNPASNNRFAMASAATVVLPTESLVLISMSCLKMSCAFLRVTASPSEAAGPTACAHRPTRTAARPPAPIRYFKTYSPKVTRVGPLSPMLSYAAFWRVALSRSAFAFRFRVPFWRFVMAKKKNRTVTRTAAEAAVQTLLLWAGEDPLREGLRETPKRVVNAYRDWFSGYTSDPGAYLRRTFEEVEGYDEMVVLRDIAFESFCEHHMAPIIGRAHIGYLPSDRVVGISKLARVVDGYARRFQVQEKLTAQIAGCINEVLKPRGVGVVIDAVHQCMTTRGVHKRGVSMVTSKMLGTFRADASTRAEFLRFIAIEGSNQR